MRKMILGFPVAIMLMAASAQAQGAVWSATFTPGDINGYAFGCRNGDDDAECSNKDVLSDDTFTVGEIVYTVTEFYQTSGTNRLYFAGIRTPEDGTSWVDIADELKIGSTSLDIGDAFLSQGQNNTSAWRLRWSGDPGLDDVLGGDSLTDGTSISVTLISGDLPPPPPPPTTPGAPTGLAATANGPSQIDLAWTAPASTGGSAITGYKIEVSPDGSSWSDLVADTGSTDTAYAHMGLDPATTRHYRVSAINAVGTSNASDSDDTTTASTNTAPTGAPTITGTAEVGETLTAVTTGIADADGLTRVSYTYQWIRVDGTEADIAAANSSTYTLVDADLGTTLKVRVTFDDDDGNTETLTSAATATVVAAGNTAPTGAPTITGTAEVGETLTAVTTGIADADGLTSPAYTYQWIRVNGTEADIAGENSSTYTLVDADLGTTLKVRVSFTDDASNSETLTSAATATVVAAATAPTVSNVAVTSTPASGTTYYLAGEAIEFTVTFSAPVTVTATPKFAFRLGAATRQAAYESGSDSAALVFARTVQAGEVDRNGISWNALALALDGGTITQTGATTAASLTHAEQAPLAGHRVDAAPPMQVSASVHGMSLVLVYDEPLDPASMPATGAYTVTATVGATTTNLEVSEVSIYGIWVTLALDAAPAAGATVTLAYAPPASNPVQDEAGNDAPAFSGQSVRLGPPPPDLEQVMGVGVVPGNAQLVVTWTAVDNATGYTVQWKSGGQGYNTTNRQATVTSGSTTSHTITGLANGTEYTVQVSATRTGSNDGPPSDEMTGTPTVPTAAGIAVSTAALTVTEQDSTGDGYTVVLDTEPTADVVVTVAGHVGTDVTANPTALTFTMSNWETAQTVTVTADNDTDTTDDSVTLTHSAASADSGYSGIAIAGVAVTVNDNDTAQVLGVGVAPGNATPAGGDLDGSGQRLGLHGAVDESGDGTDRSGQAYNTTVVLDTGRPRSRRGRPRVTRSRQRYGHHGPVANGTEYTVQVSATRTAAPTTATRCRRAARPQADFGVDERSRASPTYTVQVSATRTGANDGRLPTASPGDGPCAGAGGNGRPGQRAAGGDLDGGVHRHGLHGAVDGAGRAGQQGYNTGDRQATVTTGSTTRYTIPSLANGTEYTVRVIATRTGANDGPPSAEVTASPVTTPGAPQHLSAVPGYEQVTLTWDAPSSDGGSAILRYEVAVDDSGTWIDAGLDLEETVTGLTNGQRYTFAVRAVNAAGTGPAATVTIVTSNPLPQAWLARFGRAATDHVVDAVSSRWQGGPQASHLTIGGVQTGALFGWIGRVGQAARDTADDRGDPVRTETSWTRLFAPSGGPGTGGGGTGPGMTVTDRNTGPVGLGGVDRKAGATLSGRAAQSALLGALGLPDPRALTDLRAALLGSSFFYSGARDEDGQPRTPGGFGEWSVWGRGAASWFSGTDSGLSLDGEVVTAMLGFDSRWERWLAGVVVSHSRGQGTYTHPTATGGAVASSLTALHPYAGYKFNERTSIWGVLGYGVGEMSLTPERSVTALETGLMNAMAAVGGRTALLVRSGPARRFELAIRSDARLTNTSSDAVGAMAGAAGQTHRVRMMLEGSGVMPLASGWVLKPRLEAGLRYDAGDAETGAGLEVGGGLGGAFGRLSLEVNARGLLAHRDTQYEEWGFSGAVAYTPSKDGRGVSLRLGSGWGATQSGVQSLWRRQDASDLVRHAEFDAVQRYQVELRYGLDGLKGRVRWTPYIGVDSGGGSSRALRLGVTLTSGRRFDAGLELGRRQGGPGAGPEHAGQIRATLLW